MIRQFDRVSAVFNPKRTDDLALGADAMIGRRFNFTADFIIDDGFPYEGDWHMSVDYDTWKGTGIFWVPLCDLDDIRPINIRQSNTETGEVLDA